MKKTILYTYLGTNGTITSPVHLEGIYYVRKIRLSAEDGKKLVNGKREEISVTVAENEVQDWTEVTA